jgi:hypothetical protein
MKFFVSAIIPGVQQVGAMQFEAANEAECQQISESLCPTRAAFRAYELQEFEEGLPVGTFVEAKQLKELGY